MRGDLDRLLDMLEMCDLLLAHAGDPDDSDGDPDIHDPDSHDPDSHDVDDTSGGASLTDLSATGMSGQGPVVTGDREPAGWKCSSTARHRRRGTSVERPSAIQTAGFTRLAGSADTGGRRYRIRQRHPTSPSSLNRHRRHRTRFRRFRHLHCLTRRLHRHRTLSRRLRF
jgi:hypothetical protein